MTHRWQKVRSRASLLLDEGGSAGSYRPVAQVDAGGPHFAVAKGGLEMPHRGVRPQCNIVTQVHQREEVRASRTGGTVG